MPTYPTQGMISLRNQLHKDSRLTLYSEPHSNHSLEWEFRSDAGHEAFVLFFLFAFRSAASKITMNVTPSSACAFSKMFQLAWCNSRKVQYFGPTLQSMPPQPQNDEKSSLFRIAQRTRDSRSGRKRVEAQFQTRYRRRNHFFEACRLQRIMKLYLCVTECLILLLGSVPVVLVNKHGNRPLGQCMN